MYTYRDYEEQNYKKAIKQSLYNNRKNSVSMPKSLLTEQTVSLILNNSFFFSQNHLKLCLTILYYFAITVSVGVAVVSTGVVVVSA